LAEPHFPAISQLIQFYFLSTLTVQYNQLVAEISYQFLQFSGRFGSEKEVKKASIAKEIFMEGCQDLNMLSGWTLYL
jgi:hypothetical protein